MVKLTSAESGKLVNGKMVKPVGAQAKMVKNVKTNRAANRYEWQYGDAVNR